MALRQPAFPAVRAGQRAPRHGGCRGGRLGQLGAPRFGEPEDGIPCAPDRAHGSRCAGRLRLFHPHRRALRAARAAQARRGYPPAPAGLVSPSSRRAIRSPLTARSAASERGARGRRRFHPGARRSLRSRARRDSPCASGPSTRPRRLVPDRSQVDRFARFLAKFGVNMVRLHGPCGRRMTRRRSTSSSSIGLHASSPALGRTRASTSSCRRTSPSGFNTLAGPGFEGYDHDQQPFGLSFFNQKPSAPPEALVAGRPDVAESVHGRARSRKTRRWRSSRSSTRTASSSGRSRRTERSGAADGDAREALRRVAPQAGRQAASPQDVRRGWGGAPPLVRGDDRRRGRAGFVPLFDSSPTGATRARATRLASSTEVQRGYFDEMFRFLKKDLGFEGSVTGSNWITADARRLGPLDKWSNAGCDFMDRHGYYAGRTRGGSDVTRSLTGIRYNDALAAAFRDRQARRAVLRACPSWTSPTTASPRHHRDQLAAAESLSHRHAALAAAYGASAGLRRLLLLRGERAGVGQRSSRSSRSRIPAAHGSVPGGRARLPPGARQDGGRRRAPRGLDLPSLPTLEGVPIAAPQNLDAAPGPRRHAARALRRRSGDRRIDPLAFLTGRVEVNVTARTPGVSQMTELSPFIDSRRQDGAQARRASCCGAGARGLATIDAPAAQGAVGLLAQAGALALGDVTIASRNEYGAVLLVSLDGRAARAVPARCSCRS